MNKSILKKIAIALFAGIFASAALVGCGGDSKQASSSASSQAKAAKNETIKVGASPTPHAQILEQVQGKLAEQGYKLEIVEFNDYIQPNKALEVGDLDANFFQHISYLNEYNEQNGTHLQSAGGIHFEPFGIYAGKTMAIDQLYDGATIAVPNDTTNEARALKLLEQEGIITLKPGAGLTATKADIATNPRNIIIREVEAAQLPKILQDVDLACINGNYALEAGLLVADALAVESTESDAADAYVNVIAVKDGNQLSAKTQALIEAISTADMIQYMDSTFKGAVVPLF